MKPLKQAMHPACAMRQQTVRLSLRCTRQVQLHTLVMSDAKLSEVLETHQYFSSFTVNESLVSPRAALRKTRNSLRLDREVKLNEKEDAPPVAQGNNYPLILIYLFF